MKNEDEGQHGIHRLFFSLERLETRDHVVSLFVFPIPFAVMRNHGESD